MIRTFTIMNGVENVDSETFLSLSCNTRRTRGHPRRMLRGRFRIGEGYFTQIHSSLVELSAQACSDDHLPRWLQGDRII